MDISIEYNKTKSKMKQIKAVGTRIRRSKSDVIFDTINVFLLILVTFIVAYPLFFCIIASFSNPTAVALGEVMFFPKGLTIEPYTFAFQDERIWRGYLNSIFYTSASTFYCIALTIPAAYVLSKKNLPFKLPITIFFLITMYFGGGMIPTYLNISNLGLLNTPWVMILGTGIACRNLIISRQYFASNIPEEIYEAAHIDGASQIKAFFKIAMPLAVPIVAVMALYYAVGSWNAYLSGLLYLKDTDLFPLQLVLRNILILNQSMEIDWETMSQAEIDLLQHREHMTQAMKYSIIFIASAPLLIAYPFVQKHFVKGAMIGSVKG